MLLGRQFTKACFSEVVCQVYSKKHGYFGKYEDGDSFGPRRIDEGRHDVRRNTDSRHEVNESLRFLQGRGPRQFVTPSINHELTGSNEISHPLNTLCGKTKELLWRVKVQHLHRRVEIPPQGSSDHPSQVFVRIIIWHSILIHTQ